MTTAQHAEADVPQQRTRKRLRPPPDPMAFAFTLEDAQRMGAPGRTKIYEMFQTGHLKRISAGGRTLVEGDSLRALLLGDTPAAAAAAALPKAKAKAGTDRLTGTAAASASAT